jgi:hypothetical protein
MNDAIQPAAIGIEFCPISPPVNFDANVVFNHIMKGSVMTLSSITPTTAATVSAQTPLKDTLSTQSAQGTQKTGKHHHGHHHKGSAAPADSKTDTAQISDQAKELASAAGTATPTTDSSTAPN